MKGLGEVLAGFLERAEALQPTRQAAVLLRWPEIVGPAVARHARAQSVRRGVLTVAVDSGVWATELSAHTPVVLERIESTLGPGIVTDLRFVVRSHRAQSDALAGPSGDYGEPSPPWPNRRDLAAVRLTEDDLTQVRTFAAAARDPVLAQAAGHWLGLTLKARRWLEERSKRKTGLDGRFT
ncbi:MAG: DUF721 domain-containing protein [Bacillota bacterium]|nr:MAG: DUF721 domain-containing protein [Bacillota bacterium]